MNIIGIIAEYNPFHMGHKYQLTKAKEAYGADAVVAVISGDFTQRGGPAIISKYERAKIALNNGADIVLMMPALFSVSSAEGFAQAGVSALSHTGIVNSLLFSAEEDNIDTFQSVAGLLQEESPEFKEKLQEGLRNGLSFPVAREQAIRAILPMNGYFLSYPNNILGIEYVKALLQRKSDIKPIVMKRMGSDFHDASMPDDISEFASAAAVRRVIEKENLSFAKTVLTPALAPDILEPLLKAIEEKTLLLRDDASLLLHEALLSTDDYSVFADCSEDLSNRIRNHRNEFMTYTSFIDILKTKEMTYSRISRVLMHILLGIREKDVAAAKEMDYVPYLRVLGFSEKGESIMGDLKEKTDVPIITNVKDADKVLTGDALKVFRSDIKAADYYRAMLTNKSGLVLETEYTRKFR